MAKYIGCFEGEKEFVWDVDNDKSETLRLIYIWNVSSNRRTCALSNVSADMNGHRTMRNGHPQPLGEPSENTFKHIGNKHPLKLPTWILVYRKSESGNRES